MKERCQVLWGIGVQMLSAMTFLFASGNQVYSQDSLNISSLYNWQNPSLPASNTWSNTYNEIWGHAVNGREFAIIGSTNGTHIIDVTDPSLASEVVFIEGAAAGPQVIHRDYHTYGDYLYMVCDEGASTLQIADLGSLPEAAPVLYDSDALFSRSHNIFIDTASAHLYVVGNSSWVSVYSLVNPLLPELLVDCRTDLPFWSSIGYVHDIFVRNDTAYCNAETRGLFVVDFNDMDNPIMIGALPVYPQQGYNHSGWLMDNAPYYAMADETHGKALKIVDVSDIQNLVVTDTLSSGVNPFSLPHNLIYHDDFLYVSYYFDGMYVFNCEDPAHPTLAGFYDTSTETHANNDYRGCWGVYPFLPSGRILASDMQTGLWVFDVDEALHTSVGEVIGLKQAQPLLLFPNPTNDHIQLSDQYAGMPFSIYNVLGIEFLSGVINPDGSIQGVSNLVDGAYMLRVGDKGSVVVGRFIKG